MYSLYMSGFRNYKKTRLDVEKTYSKIFQNQYLEIVLELKERYRDFPNNTYNIYEAIEKLDEIVDESDPDTEVSQLFHAYQTGESIYNRFFKDGKFLNPPIRMLFKIREWNKLPTHIKELYSKARFKDLFPHINDWSWLPLVGFIHDLGKVLALEEWGALPQWSVVGDTFPVGCSLTDSVIYKEHHNQNKDHVKYDKIGIYNKNCGFDSLHMSWGHDEYLSMVLNKNIELVKLPEEALYMIRFHSFYAWHSPRNNIRGYTYFANLTDWKRLPLIKILQLSDLYSKNHKLPDIEQLREKYTNLINHWFTKSDLLW